MGGYGSGRVWAMKARLIMMVIFVVWQTGLTAAGTRSVQELAREAELVVRGEITKIRCSRQNNGKIETTLSVKIMETWKGEVARQTIIVGDPTGILGEIRQTHAQHRPFRLGEECIWFLVKSGDEKWVPVSLWQGRFSIEKNADTGVESAGNISPRDRTNGDFDMTIQVPDLRRIVTVEAGQ